MTNIPYFHFNTYLGWDCTLLVELILDADELTDPLLGVGRADLLRADDPPRTF